MCYQIVSEASEPKFCINSPQLSTHFIPQDLTIPSVLSLEYNVCIILNGIIFILYVKNVSIINEHGHIL
jgi:hypothetical protein